MAFATLVCAVGCSSSQTASNPGPSAASARTDLVTNANSDNIFSGMQQASLLLDLGTCLPPQPPDQARVTAPNVFPASSSGQLNVIACVQDAPNGIEIFYSQPPVAPKPCTKPGSGCVGGIYGGNFLITDTGNTDQSGACVAIGQLSGLTYRKIIDSTGQPLSC